VFHTAVRILEHKGVAPGYVRMGLDAPEVARTIAPGQFVYVRCSETLDPLLCRPFSVAAADPADGTIDLIFRTVGRGTALLAAMEPGQRLELTGPLGHGFDLPPRRRTAVLVGGGVGVPPLIFLADRLAKDGVSSEAFIGAQTADLLLGIEEFERDTDKLHPATDDGSAGHHGLPTELLKDRLARDTECEVYACGPHELLRAVAELTAEHNVPCQVCLESQMGCGLGACLGCVIAAPAEGDGIEYVRVCTEGPVFDARRVVW